MMFALCFIFVVICSAILFGGWVVVSIGKMIWRAIVGNNKPWLPTSAGMHCTNAGCQTPNPMHANYCRRCGAHLTNQTGLPRTAGVPAPRYQAATGQRRQVAAL